MASDEKIVLKAVAKAYTIDELIAQLERMKKAGAPGTSVINQSLKVGLEVQQIRGLMANEAASSASKQDPFRPSYKSQEDIQKESERRELLRKARFSLWVEYEA